VEFHLTAVGEHFELERAAGFEPVVLAADPFADWHAPAGPVVADIVDAFVADGPASVAAVVADIVEEAVRLDDIAEFHSDEELDSGPEIKITMSSNEAS
jgi:hypothetical protein